MNVPPDILVGVARKLAEHAGLETPMWVIEARVKARASALELDPAGYLALLAGSRGRAELDELIEAVRVGESRLFRHRSQIAALVDHVIPRWRDKLAIRIWSAGCAAGQEPYTLAAILANELPDAKVSIVASDVSADALALARTASFPARGWDEVPDAYRGAFELAGDRVRVVPAVAATVRFERANLADPLGAVPSHCDLVWCRNVLIYFTPAARRRVIARLIGATSPGGYVFVGYSESLRDIAELEAVRAGDAVFYVRHDPASHHPRPTRPDAALTASASPQKSTPAPPLAPSIPRTHAPAMTEPPEHVLALLGRPDPKHVTADLSARLASPGSTRMVIDLDGTTMIDDELAPVLRRACAAARAAGVTVVLRATKHGARRWLARHHLEGFNP